MPYDEPEAGLSTPVRSRYVFGQLLGVADLEREQEYATPSGGSPTGSSTGTAWLPASTSG